MAVQKSKKMIKPKRPLTHKNKSHPILGIIARGLLLLTPLIYLSYIKFEFQPFQELLFLQVILLIKLIGLQFQTFGYTIITSSFSSIITFDCTAWRQFYLYFAMVLLPAEIAWGKRLWGMAFLIPLHLYNTLRAVFSIWVGTVNYNWFKPVHWFLWEFFFLVLIYVFWRYWFEWVKKHPK
jgi:exosortase/archaeosortase family protein